MPIMDRTLFALSLRRIVAAFFLVVIISLQIFSVYLSDNLGKFHKKQLSYLSTIRTSATSAHLVLEQILAGDSEEDPEVVEERLTWAIEQARLLPMSCREASLIPHHYPLELEGMVHKVIAQLESLRLLSRQRLRVSVDRATQNILTVQYDDTFSELIDTTNGLEPALWGARDQDKAFLFKIDVSMVMISVALALLIVLAFHRYDLARKRAIETISEKKEREQFISQFSRFCRDTAAMEPVYEMVSSWLAQHLRVNRGSVWMFQNEGASLLCCCLYELDGNRFSRGQVLLRDELPQYFETIQKGEALIVTEGVQTCSGLEKFAAVYLKPLDIRSYLNFPIKREGNTVGLLALSVQDKTREWSEEEANLCNIIADQLSIAFSRIEERELREKTQIDHAIRLEEEVRERTRELEGANRTLKENEARLQLTFNKAPFGALLVDLEKNILNANEEFCRMIGYTPEELVSRPFADLIHPDYRESCLGNLDQILGGDLKVSGADKKYLCKDGELVWGRTTIRLVRDENGEPFYFLPTVEDVSERKLYEEQLKRLYKAIEQSPLSIVITDPHGNIEYANPFFCAVTGYALGEVIGKKPSALKSGVHDAAFYRNMWQTISAGKIWQGEVCNRKKDGTLFWEHATISPVTDNHGKVVSYIAVKEDISERKQLTDTLQEHTEILASIAAAALSAIIMMDSDGRITFWNKAAEQIFGWSREEALGQDLHRLIAPVSCQERFLANFGRFRESGEGAIIGNRVEVSALRKEGAEFPVEISLSAFQVKGQWHAVGLVNDITDRKEAEESILLARDAAEEANRAKSDFLARMSHEIRTPMNAIIGLSLLGLEMELSPKVRDYLDKISTSGKNLLYIINDILDFSKIEAQKLEIEPHPFSLERVLDDLAGLTTFKAQEKGLEFLFDVAADVPDRLIGDSVRLGQVLLNLTSNAIKFTEQGEVVLEISVAERTANRLVLRFSIRDTGMGLTEEQLAKLFAPFSQADGSISRTHGGTGLGLAISKRLVELMGGAFQVESTPGLGSTFFFTAVLNEAQAPATQLFPQPDLRKLRVLVVEDNPTTRAILQGALESFSFEVEAVASGEECLEIVRRRGAENPFDLLLLDYRLPGLNGASVARAVREGLYGIGQPKIMMLTSTRIEEVIGPCLEAGCDKVLSKPVSRSGLFEAIMEMYDSGQGKDVAMVEGAERDTLGHQVKGARILLVEDNEINQQVAREILERAGVVVEIADNGETALAMVQENVYDLVLMDIQMPGMDGLEATRRIRASEVERVSTLPIVAMTANAIKGDEALSLAAGMNAHITKPIEPKTLFATLAKWLTAKEAPERIVQPPGEMPVVDEPLPRKIPGLDLVLGLERIGDAHLYRKVLLLFVEKYASMDESIGTLLAQQQWEEAGRALHTLKGVVGTICAQELFGLTLELEKACRAQQVPPELLAAFKGSHAALVQALQRLLPPASQPPAAEMSDVAIDPARLRDLLKAMLPDLQGHRPVQCAEHVAKISTIKWPADLRLEKNDLIRAVGSYQFRQGMGIVERVLAALEGEDTE
ncbi:MAG: PAS domain S-box protein [Desulfobulbaceae bacterium]|nr:PAS domain S-box protein [Desulfobulbaceae bacterium]HIJ89775.1 PAS domain S-box protein [Deltaproteobacteria bacterium]